MNNIFDSIPESIDKEIFDTIVKSENIRIERIISRGHASPESGWYDQGQNEWVIVVKGGAVISFEDDEPVKLDEGSYINIPAHKKHKVDWTDPDTETIWLAVFY
ncbi:MAG: cupin domain-containing protein [Gammaproteobacteria bacterium]|nr:cupin domain-containing protein [Gammaproteobacteria bacterium]MCW8923109.1 cupin domain-containing protein [Gammaproteobacteria bacterium]